MVQIDLPGYMGRGNVIACIPQPAWKELCGAADTYEVRADGRIAMSFTLRKGSHEARFKTYRPVGGIKDASNDRWNMQFLWPFKAGYQIAYLR